MARRKGELRGRWTRSTVATAAVMMGTACIIPDAGISVQRDFTNPGAVRIVEPTPISEAADKACGKRQGFAFCPTFTDTVPSGELKGNGQLCLCPERERDDNAPQGFEIFVEDPDVDADGRPVDDIFGVFLLDVPTDATDMTPYQAYTSEVPPDEPARRFTGEVRTIERETPGLRVFQVGGFTGGTFDVCNDNDGNALDAGLHELRFVATDRAWFAPIDPSGALDEEGNPLRLDPLIGIPDLPAGATYASTAFVFRCVDGLDAEAGQCGCFDPEAPT